MPKYSFVIRVLFFSTFLIAQVAPTEGLHQAPPGVWALTHARVYTQPGTILDDATILLRDGLVAAVGQDLTRPPEATEIDVKGATIYPGFIDSWWAVSADKKDQPPPPGSDDHWNTSVHPDELASNFFHPEETELKAARALGFTTAHIVPGKGIFRGQSALVQLTKTPTVIKNHAAQVIAFEFGGWNSTQYPNSLLGCVALIRQTFLDADWYARAQKILEKHPEGNEPVATDRALEALASAVASKTPFIFVTKDELDALRVGQLDKELQLNLWLKGSGYEYRRLNELVQLKPFIILPLNYPGKPEVANPYEALQYTTEQLKHWDLAPDNCQRLIARDFSLALTAADLEKKRTFRENLIRSVERGLDRDAALAALTTIPASQFGLPQQLGKIAPGFWANLVVVDGDYFDKQAPVREVWVEGERFIVEPAPRVDFGGNWTLIMPDTFALVIKKKGTTYSGTLQHDSAKYTLEQLTVEEDRLSWTMKGDSTTLPGVTRFVGHLGQDRAEGKALDASGKERQWQAVRVKPLEEDSTKVQPPEKASDLTVFYPEGAFGFEELPPQPAAILINDATLWTSGPQGVLKGWDMLIEQGKIKQIAPDIALPRGGTLIINGLGKHITPGIIDCHSHTALLSVNEGTQSVTAETRIQDVLNADDVAIYRELAGGVTIVHTLHGSANAIGGQNAIIKLRWGQPPEGLLFKKAPPTIKFALGENVKQSNWGDKFRTRYPQTRMGVEQIIRDAFLAAQTYRQRWQAYSRNSQAQRTKVPPRRDLEMEALVEVLEGQRFVHSHSYRQDEILMLTRIAEDFGFTIAAFQHVLEGYKVADRIAEHGAGASTFSDWWAYKFEVIDAIPYNGALMSRVGVNVSFNSDSNELARRLNTEAAKAVKYGGLSEVEALNLVTINPAKQLKIDKWVGSLEVGKDADFVVWSGPPLSTYTVCEQTWIDGRQYFSRERDRALRQRDRDLRNTLIQKILTSKQTTGTPMRPYGGRYYRNYSCIWGMEAEEGR